MAQAKKSFYAVAVGRKPGIYRTWFGPQGAETQVRGFTGARYKGFATLAEAEAWMRDPGPRTFTPRSSATSSATAPLDPDEYEILIYTDGGSIGNPGPGGWGAVIIEDHARHEISGGYRRTTNNRMELMGCIMALSQLKESRRVLVRTDSQYVVNGMNKGWARKWRKNGWMRTPDEPAENYDLWEELLDLASRHHVSFEWVRGHAGHAENERCDKLAKEMSARRDLPPDGNYEQRRTTITSRKG
jgi:ribonuclease HI